MNAQNLPADPGEAQYGSLPAASPRSALSPDLCPLSGHLEVDYLVASDHRPLATGNCTLDPQFKAGYHFTGVFPQIVQTGSLLNVPRL